MANTFDPAAFKACYAQFQTADNNRNTLVAQLLDGYESLHTENIKMREKLDNERETRMMWQETARNFKKELVQTRLATDSHPFVVMIIDGDGAKFRDDLFRNGDHGGGYAAQELKKQIKCHLQAKFPDTSIENWNIIVHFYANMDGLAKTLASRQILPSWSDLQKFASGFGRANSLFSFVDVGYGKDKADHKCREMLKVMLHVPSCRHVFFGPCRDNGYLTLLEEYKHDAIKEKLTLFTTEPAEPGFLDLGFEIITFPTVFRPEPLNNTTNSSFRYFVPGGIGIQPFPSADSQDDDVSSSFAGGSSVSTALSPTSSAGRTSASVPPVTTSWAGTAKLGSNVVIDLYSKKAPAPKLKYVLFNSANQRVDERLPSADHAAMRSLDIKASAQGRNFCNYHHLGNGCEKGDMCGYQHDASPNLTVAEKLALRHKSRQIVCGDGQWCESPYCLHGHHCKNLYDGRACSYNSNCFFKDTHGGDIKPTLKVFEDGSREVVN
ncbi:unnamed protein product [Discula destructiva]